MDLENVGGSVGAQRSDNKKPTSNVIADSTFKFTIKDKIKIYKDKLTVTEKKQLIKHSDVAWCV